MYVCGDFTILNATWDLIPTRERKTDLIFYDVTFYDFKGIQINKSADIRQLQHDTTFLINDRAENYNVTVTVKNNCEKIITAATQWCVMNNSTTGSPDSAAAITVQQVLGTLGKTFMTLMVIIGLCCLCQAED